MDVEFQVHNENPKEKANIFSKLIFAWVIPLCKKHANKGLEIYDLYKRLECDAAEKLCDVLEKNWNKEIHRAKYKCTNPSLLRAFLDTFLYNYMIFGVFLFIEYTAIRSFQPIVLAHLLSCFSNNKKEDNLLQMYMYGAILVIINIYIIFSTHHITYGQRVIGMRIRIAISSLIYRKILKLSTKSLSRITSGQIVNLLSNDVNRFNIVMISLHFLWIMPIQLIIVSYLLWQQVGISSLLGIASMILLTLPVQGYLSILISSLRLRIAKITDLRVQLMNEIISSMKVIKMFTWEEPFKKKVQNARMKETIAIKTTLYLQSIFLSCILFVERTALFLTTVCYVLLGNVMTADKAFSIAQFFNSLHITMDVFYPLAIRLGSEAWVSTKRLQEFLLLDEQEQKSEQTVEDKNIIIKDVVASWTDTTTLNNINLNISSGSLCAIIGPVGSGKSSLLKLLLGELPTKSGSIKIGGKISYFSQDPWLFNATVRNNILFGSEYNKQQYQQIIEMCALKTDLEQFPQQDLSIVGERGVSLSGGQRARINLARTIYRQADIYLMDDPLSAVDTRVGKHLFEECILTHLKHKTRILVTHQLQYLKMADNIIVLNKGKIEAQGTFIQLLQSNLDFAQYLITNNEKLERDENQNQEYNHSRQNSISSRLSIKSQEASQNCNNNEEMFTSNRAGLLDYAKSSGNCCMLLFLVTMFVLAQTACSGTDLWLTYWLEYEEIQSNNLPKQEISNLSFDSFYDKSVTLNEDADKYVYTFNHSISNSSKFARDSTWFIYIYTILIIVSILITIFRSLLFSKMAVRASKNLHAKMFDVLMQVPIKFFDTNSSGRILNRFSKDLGLVDEILPKILPKAMQFILITCGILIATIISNGYIILVIVALGFGFGKLSTYYIAILKDLQHLEGIAKSPIFSILNSSVNGIVTIRAYKAEKVLQKQFDARQDVHTSAMYLNLTCTECFGLWLDIICTVFLACVIFSSIILNQYNSIGSGLAGLAISQAMILTTIVFLATQIIANVVNHLVSVERMVQYTNLEMESPFKTSESENVPKTWPEKGSIYFNHLYLRYSEYDPPVLKNLHFLIRSGEKVGIVGRTGAGKSSIALALFRLAFLEGSIIIDGIDTKTIGLHDLRRKISIIPQEPVLFSATLRYNLDPVGEFDDMQLWNALEKAQLKDVVQSLDFMVADGGNNFSVGQRQLICLARTIVRNNKILIVDEATANVDLRTDNLIQQTVRTRFKCCTVLTIAHRLNTVMDSDKVLVMDGGRMVEFDHPHLLLQNTEGIFYQLVAETGPSVARKLHEVAANAYKKY